MKEKITKIIKEVADQYPYKKIGDRETYSSYNEGWSDACDIIEQRMISQLTQPKPSAEEWLDQEFGDAYIEHDGWGDIKFLSIGKVIEALNQYVKQ
jgi:hypothetical protein